MLAQFRSELITSIRTSLLSTPRAATQCNTLRYFSACCADAVDHSSLVTEPPEPGTVAHYDQHILIRLPRPALQGGYSGAWWPPLIEKDPVVVRAFRALASNQILLAQGFKPRVSLWDFIQGKHPLPADHCDLIVYPQGVRYRNLHIDQIELVVAHNMAAMTANPPSSSSNLNPKKPSPLPAGIKEEFLDATLMLLVCCHGSRDARCGALGPPLATALAHELKQHHHIDGASIVAACSHLGGHKYAGNVVSYMPCHPADGDWFGGLKAEDAPAFVDALAHIEIGVDGGAEHPVLRRWWRGRIGLHKHEQREVFEAGGGVEEVHDVGELDESESDEESGDSDEDEVKIEKQL